MYILNNTKKKNQKHNSYKLVSRMSSDIDVTLMTITITIIIITIIIRLLQKNREYTKRMEQIIEYDE